MIAEIINYILSCGLGLLLGSFFEYVYLDYKDKEDIKQDNAMYRERIRCLEARIRELEE